MVSETISRWITRLNVYIEMCKAENTELVTLKLTRRDLIELRMMVTALELSVLPSELEGADGADDNIRPS